MSSGRQRISWRALISLLAILVTLTSAMLPRSLGVATANGPVLVPLAGHARSSPTGYVAVGPRPPDAPLTLTIALRPRSLASVGDRFAAAVAQHHPVGPRLSLAQIKSLYGPDPAGVTRLEGFLRQAGLRIAGEAPDGLSLRVAGTTAQVENALGVTLTSYRASDGATRFATASDPLVPADVAPTVEAIFGLDDLPVVQPSDLLERDAATASRAAASPGQPAAKAQTVTAGSYGPADLAQAYDISTLYHLGNPGLNGAGQTIGIIGCSAYLSTDVSSFDAAYGIPDTPISQVDVDVPGGGTSPDPETTLALEWAHAFAPGAQLRVYSFPYVSSANPAQSGCPVYGLYDAVVAAVTDQMQPAAVLDIGVGLCEAAFTNSNGSNFLTGIENELLIGALEGQGVFAESGTSGAFACTDSNGQPVLSVVYPASSHWVTAVGGTSLTLNASDGIVGETAWNSSKGVSGGGVSSYIAEPPWQATVSNNQDPQIQLLHGFRGVPDVAFDADPTTGVTLYYQGAMYSGIGGTAVGSAAWSGYEALLNQLMGFSLGLLTPYLYCLEASPTQCPVVAAPLRDITAGSNGGYAATTGWDLVTGWGAPDGFNLAVDLLDFTAPIIPQRVYVPIVAANASFGGPPSTAIPTPAPSDSPTSTPTETAPATSSATATPSATPTASPSSSATDSPTESPAASPSLTASPTETDTVSPLPTGSATASPTETETMSPTPTASLSLTASETATPALSATTTSTPPLLETPTASPPSTATVAVLPTTSATETATATPSDSATPSATSTAIPSPSPIPSATPSVTATATTTPSPTFSPTSPSTSTPTPSVTATATDSATVTSTASSITATASPTTSAVPTATATADQTLPTTPTPSDTDTPTPTATPSDAATTTGTSSPTETWISETLPAEPSETPTATSTATPAGSISGTVWDTLSFAVLPNVAVSVAGPGPTYDTSTNVEGIYAVVGIPSGVYTVTASLAGYAPSSGVVVVGSNTRELDLFLAPLTPTVTTTPTATPTVSVTETSTVTATPTLTATSTATASPTATATATDTATGTATATVVPGQIGGEVRDAANGNFLANVTITAIGPDGSASTTSLADGSYLLADLAPGQYQVTATLDGYVANTHNDGVAANVTSQDNFVLAPEATPSPSPTGLGLATSKELDEGLRGAPANL